MYKELKGKALEVQLSQV